MEFAIRVTDKCNLNCDYCYARVENPKVMTVDTLDKTIREVAKLSSRTNDPITISWTGGEPLTQGQEFFETLTHIEEELGKDKFINILQSNLILLNSWFVAYLKEHNFQVRTSLDLPLHNHEELRKNGDALRSIRSINLLKKAGVPVNVNTVITHRNIDRAREIFDSLKELGITSFSVSRLVDQGNATKHPELTIYDNDKFGKFLITLFDLWMEDTAPPIITRITPLDKLAAACERGVRDEHSKCFHCQSQMFAIGPEGHVYPSCNKFFALPETCLGNLNESSLQEVMESKERKEFLSLTGDVSTRVCSKCEYVELCEGGCYYVAHNARVRNQDMHTRERFCKGYYLVFEHILNYLKKEKSCLAFLIA